MNVDLTILQHDIAELSAHLQEGAQRLQYGSYADRNPALGPMKRCPVCRVRRRQFSPEPCCNPSHATTKRAWDEEKGFYQEPCDPRVTEISIKKMVKKIQHKRHSNLFRHQIHDMALFLRDDAVRAETQLQFDAMSPFHKPQKKIPVSAIPSYAEKIVRAIREMRAKQKRRQQALALRINFGLTKG